MFPHPPQRWGVGGFPPTPTLSWTSSHGPILTGLTLCPRQSTLSLLFLRTALQFLLSGARTTKPDGLWSNSCPDASTSNSKVAGGPCCSVHCPVRHQACLAFTASPSDGLTEANYLSSHFQARKLRTRNGRRDISLVNLRANSCFQK